MAEDYTAEDVDEALEDAAGEASLLEGHDLPMTAFHHHVLADQVHRLRDALHALVDEEVLGDTGYPLDGCVHCKSGWEADGSTMGRTVHAEDCPWAKARALLAKKGAG